MLTWHLLFVADPTLTLDNFVGVIEKVTPDKEKECVGEGVEVGLPYSRLLS